MILGHTGEGHGPGDPHGDVNQFLSRHGRGSYFAYCDGHVRYLRNEMDYKVYKALSTRAGGSSCPMITEIPSLAGTDTSRAGRRDFSHLHGICAEP